MKFISIIKLVFLVLAFFGKLIAGDERTNGNKTRDASALLLAVLMIGGGLLFLVSTSLHRSASTEASTPAYTPPKAHIQELMLNQIIVTRLARDQEAELTFHSFEDRFITLHIKPSSGEMTSVQMTGRESSEIAPEITQFTSNDDGDIVICGLEMLEGFDYNFTFVSPRTTNYRIEFTSGNTCDE